MSNDPGVLTEQFECPPPAQYYFDPGNLCNLRCPFCPTGRREGDLAEGLMSRETFDVIFDKVEPYAKVICFYSWGEPFLNKHLLYFASRCSERGIRSQVDSNLNLREISDGEAEAIVRSGLGQIYGSIDGVTQESYVKYRRRGKIDRALRNLAQIARAKRRLGAATPDVGWNYLINRFNEHEIDQARALAKEMGVHIEFKLMSCWDPSWESSFHRSGVLPTSSDDARIGEHSESVVAPDGAEAPAIQRPLSVRAPQDPPLPSLPESNVRTLPMALSQLRLHAELPPWCMQPFNFMVVNWDGKVMPCCTVHGDEYAIGDLVADPFEVVWGNVQFRSARRFLYNFGAPQATGSVCERLPCPVNPKHARTGRSLQVLNSQ